MFGDKDTDSNNINSNNNSNNAENNYQNGNNGNNYNNGENIRYTNDYNEQGYYAENNYVNSESEQAGNNGNDVNFVMQENTNSTAQNTEKNNNNTENDINNMENTNNNTESNSYNSTELPQQNNNADSEYRYSYYNTEEDTHKWEAYNSNTVLSEKEMKKKEKQAKKAEKKNARKEARKSKKVKSGKFLAMPVVIAVICGIVVGGALVAVGYTIGDDSSSSVSSTSIITGTSTSSDSDDTTSSDSLELTDVSDVVEDFMPCMVALTSMTEVDDSTSDWYSYYFGDDSDDSDSDTEEVESGAGSGVIIAENDTELLILTSYHVVEDSSSIEVTFVDDNTITGYIKSSDSSEDLAIVAVLLEDIDEDTLSSIKIATISTDEVEVGEGVIAIGNALGYGQSVTTGIISATDREVTVDSLTLTLLQTDAAINAGNSGGALINSSGELIGINEAKYSSTDVEGMCFAISVSDKTDIIEELINAETQEKVDEEDQGYLGIYGTSVSSIMSSTADVPEGVYVSSIIEGGAAEGSGLEKSDIITALDGETVSSMEDLQDLLEYYAVGDTVELTVYTVEGNEYVEETIEITLGEAVE